MVEYLKSHPEIARKALDGESEIFEEENPSTSPRSPRVVEEKVEVDVVTEQPRRTSPRESSRGGSDYVPPDIPVSSERTVPLDEFGGGSRATGAAASRDDDDNPFA